MWLGKEQENVTAADLVDGPEPLIGGVGVSARGEQVGGLGPDPGHLSNTFISQAYL